MYEATVNRGALTELYAKAKQAEAKRNQEMLQRAQQEELESKRNIGNPMMQGAMLGGAFSGGSPIGMGIGAGLGLLAGGAKAFHRGISEPNSGVGEGFKELGQTVLNPGNWIPGFETAAPAAQMYMQQNASDKWQAMEDAAINRQLALEDQAKWAATNKWRGSQAPYEQSELGL